MQLRRLGRNGPEVSAIGLGTWPIGGGLGRVEARQGIDVVRSAIDSGITLLDTAQAYRTSEETLGKALRDGYRERCFLCTKVSRGFSRLDIRNAMENSLRSLGVDHVEVALPDRVGGAVTLRSVRSPAAPGSASNHP